VLPYTLAVLSYHPMPYHVAFYRALHQEPRIRETVLYLDDFGVREQFDPEFNQTVTWDNNILAGHNHKFFRNFTWNPFKAPFGRINPGVFFEIAFGRYDAVLLDYANVSAWFAYLAARLRGRAVIMRAEADLNRPYRTKWTQIKRRFLSTVLKHCDAVMYSCEKNRQYFKSFGVPDDKLFPILSSVDNTYFTSLLESCTQLRIAQRNKYGIPQDAVVAIFSGRLIQRKRPLDLLAAYKQISSQQKNLWLIYIGDGPLREIIEQETHSAIGLDQVLCVGFRNQSELPAHYMMADFFVMPSEWDPTPKALNEAVVSGLPSIVSTGIGQANDLIVDSVNGFVFEVGNIEQLSQAMLSISKDRLLRETFSKRAQAAALEEWSPEKNAQGVVAALDYIFHKKQRLVKTVIG
jgi:glycosyltransferase involved in cell wall biosynthesis